MMFFFWIGAAMSVVSAVGISKLANDRYIELAAEVKTVEVQGEVELIEDAESYNPNLDNVIFFKRRDHDGN